MPNTHKYSGHSFTTDRLDDGSDPTYAACSVVCLDPVIDDHDTDQTP